MIGLLKELPFLIIKKKESSVKTHTTFSDYNLEILRQSLKAFSKNLLHYIKSKFYSGLVITHLK